MIGYVILGTNDVARAAAFYDVLLHEIGAGRVMEFDRGIAYGTAPGKPMLAVMRPFDGQPATVGNGVMAAIAAGSREQVDLLSRKAMELGARDEGAAGPRGDSFYAGYFRDPDGNKLAVYCMG
jgi:catechol 2,3-dioxygenase-like lactoylglutathione lyase family enzyme